MEKYFLAGYRLEESFPFAYVYFIYTILLHRVKYLCKPEIPLWFRFVFIDLAFDLPALLPYSSFSFDI